MKASNILKKQIIIEIIALFFLIGCLLYSYLAITKKEQNVKEKNGIVMVLDDTAFKKIEPLSDGKGFQTDKITYTITNNSKEIKEYNIIVKFKTSDDTLLNHIKVGIDGLYAYSLNDLEKKENGYILTTNRLEQGFTKVHVFQYWLDNNQNKEISKEEIELSYELEE